MTATAQRLTGLGGLGVALAAWQHFGPLLWPYALGSAWSVSTQAWFFVVDLLWIAAMLATYRRDPHGAMWKLILLYLGVGAIGTIWVIPTSLTWTLSHVAVGFGGVVFVHLVLAFPGGRLADRYDRFLVSIAYVLLAVSRLAWLVVWKPPFDKVGFSPRNPFVLWPNPDLAWLFGVAAIVVMTPFLLVAVLVGLWRRWHGASPALRRALLPIVVAAPLQLGLTVAWHLADADPSGWASIRTALQQPVAGLAGLVFPVGFLLGLLGARLARGSIADLAVELGRGVPLGGLRDLLARALRDPTLVLAFPAPSGGGFVDPNGRPIELPVTPDRATARLERDDETLAVLVYDPAIEAEDRGRVMAVGSMARLALENERLAAEVRAQLDEVRASRARIVEAGDRERRRVERDLHDGAQQRLVALAMRLDQARGRTDGAYSLIDEVESELRVAIQEVRDLSRGLHPVILADAGLAAAVESLAERAPIPILIALPPERFPALVEATAYFVVAEALTNVARHARASRARVSGRVEAGTLTLEVADDGRGGVDPEAGSGLRGLVDRVAAAGGTLTWDNSSAAGTVIRAEIPLA